MAGFEIKTSNSKKGKGMFATRNYEKGDIILEEDPLVSCQFAWNAAYKYLACDYCMRPLETPEQNVRRLANKPDIVLPHPDCFDTNLESVTSCDECGILYCSETCKQRALGTYHRILCYEQNDAMHPITILLDAWKPLHYPPESTNILLLVRILASIQLSPDPAATAALFKQFCHRTVNEDAELVHKLLGEQFVSQLNTLRELTMNVVSGENVQEFLTPEGFLSLMALIGTNGQGVGTSPLAMWVNAATDLTMSDDEKQQLDLKKTSRIRSVPEHGGLGPVPAAERVQPQLRAQRGVVVPVRQPSPAAARARRRPRRRRDMHQLPRRLHAAEVATLEAEGAGAELPVRVLVQQVLGAGDAGGLHQRRGHERRRPRRRRLMLQPARLLPARPVSTPSIRRAVLSWTVIQVSSDVLNVLPNSQVKIYLGILK